MYFKNLISLLIIVFLLFACQAPRDAEEQVSSPYGKINVSFFLKDGAPAYQVNFKNRAVIKPSRLGFVLQDSESLDKNFLLHDVERISFEEEWQPVWGTQSTIRSHYNELRLTLRQDDALQRDLILTFRVFDDGVGFRYTFPRQANLNEFAITDELTQFRLSEDLSCWWIPANYDSYEQLYNNTPLSELDSVNTPLTMESTDGNLFLSFHEADLTDYAGMTLIKNPQESLTLECDLAPWPDGIKVKAGTPHHSPWRTIQISENPGDLILSNLILNLNEPNKLTDVSWIEPMKYMGIWWGMHIGKYTWHAGPKHGATTKIAKQYIDFAAKHGIRGMLIEGWNKGWENWGEANAFDFINPYPDFDIKAVAEYAKANGVMLIGHHESGGDTPTYEAQLDSSFAMYQKLGVRAVKTGYAGTIRPQGQHHHGQWMVRHYRMVVEKAAEYQIMLDAHEPIKDTGIRRTYPNMMTREGVRGMEYNAWSDGNPPEHTTILPFTRMLSGPLDYTPGIFDLTFNEYKKDRRVHTTLAKQLALFVVLYSPLQMAADLWENYVDQPAFQFIKDVPVNWDVTLVPHAKIGDYITIARKAGENWYVGSITDASERTLQLTLDFLEAGRRYRVERYADGAEADWEKRPLAITIDQFEVKSGDTIDLELAAGGGQALRITTIQ